MTDVRNYPTPTRFPPPDRKYIRLTDAAGFVPKAYQLASLLDSGDALQRYLRERYPEVAVPNIENEAYDPTIQVGYDIFDAMRDAKTAEQNLKRAAKEKSEIPTNQKEPPPTTAEVTSPTA